MTMCKVFPSIHVAHYPVENCMIIPKVELDLDIFEINLKGQCAVICISRPQI